ncbi:hypothetical protein U9M48_027412 [Paspalum notatum var. saurae]|uniref:Protein kinase domain-containing protein n=1 Tax=Paspalum notatum var. saurae TaxID=547442 RepID=A0AAQ3X0F0_PASNO
MPLHVHPLFLLLPLLLLATSLPASATSSCAGRDDAAIVAAAFRYVRNFRAPRVKACQPVRELRLPSRNLTGAVSWAALANLSALAALDLSGNALQGAIPGGFWRAPSLRALDVSRNQLGGALRVGPCPRLLSLNVSGNRFTAVDGVEALPGLVALDVSANRIRAVPPGLRRLARLRRLDLSANAMQGRFPDDLPPLGAGGVRALNVSYNNFSGVVDAGAVKKFGRSAFVQAGNNTSLVFSDRSTAAPRRPRPSPSPPRGKSNKTNGGSGGRTERKAATRSKKRSHLGVVAVAAICGVASLAMLLCLVGCVACGVLRRRSNGGKYDDEEKKPEQWGEKEEEEDAVVAAAKGASAAPVVLFERPLMQLTLADLAAATSGFGRESQLAERGGRSGAAYRAVLPGDLHVVVRVVEGDVAALGEDEAAAAFRELARLRHPNILPLLGYCIAGKEKLVLYEYMEKGDLHRWLHELPSGRPDMDDADAGSGDIWEAAEDTRSISDWPTRHRIALGVARGLAFLHQGWAGAGAVVHGHLVPTNVLLGEDLEPRISDFGPCSPTAAAAAAATAEGDVYAFGVVVLELVTGQAGWDEASVSWARGMVRDGKALDMVDPRIRDAEAAAGVAEAEREMVECLRVGYLCTAQSPEKRPTMQQVVGVLKDIRAAPATPVVGVQ